MMLCVKELCWKKLCVKVVCESLVQKSCAWKSRGGRIVCVCVCEWFVAERVERERAAGKVVSGNEDRNLVPCSA